MQANFAKNCANGGKIIWLRHDVDIGERTICGIRVQALRKKPGP